MGYLLYSDYNRIIQTENLQQIISNDDSIRLYSEQAAYEEVISYLIQKYDVGQEFEDTQIYSMTGIYNAGQTVQLSGVTYSGATTYNSNDIVQYNNLCYYCSGTSQGLLPFQHPQHWEYKGTEFNSAITYLDSEYVIYSGSTYYTSGSSVGIPGETGSTWIFQPSQTYSSAVTFNTNDIVQYSGNCYITVIQTINVLPDSPFWVLLGNQDDLYNVKIPNFRFDYNLDYNIGDKVFYTESVYECILPATNIYPTNSRYWSGSTYSVDSKLITDTLFFTKGDARSQQMIGIMVDLTLYNIHSRVSPRNVPDVRVKRRDDAISWLKMASMGKITPTWLNKTPRVLTKFRSYSNPKNNNKY